MKMLWLKVPQRISHSGDLSLSPSCGENDTVSDHIRLHKDTIREDTIELSDPLSSMCAHVHKEFEIAGHATAVMLET